MIDSLYLHLRVLANTYPQTLNVITLFSILLLLICTFFSWSFVGLAFRQNYEKDEPNFVGVILTIIVLSIHTIMGMSSFVLVDFFAIKIVELKVKEIRTIEERKQAEEEARHKSLPICTIEQIIKQNKEEMKGCRVE